jgi:hypothetical protein
MYWYVGKEADDGPAREVAQLVHYRGLAQLDFVQGCFTRLVPRFPAILAQLALHAASVSVH